MPFRAALGMLIMVGLSACADPQEAVRTKRDAVAIAKAEWGEGFVAGRKLRGGRADEKWVVQREWRAGEPTEEAIIIDARTGHVERSSTKAGTLVLNRR